MLNPDNRGKATDSADTQTQAGGRLVLDRDVCLRRWTSRNAHVWVASTKEDGGAPLVEGSDGSSAGTCLNTERELTGREVPVTVRTGGFRLDNLRSDDAKQVEVHHVRVGITCDFQGFSSMLNKGGPWFTLDLGVCVGGHDAVGSRPLTTLPT